MLVLLGVLGAVADRAVGADDGVADRCSVVVGAAHLIGPAEQVLWIRYGTGGR